MRRNAGFTDGDFGVAEDEIEVAEALLLLPFRRYSKWLLPCWGRKRPRFATRLDTQQKPQFLANAMRSSPSSPLDLRSYDMHELCNSTPPLPQPISQQNDASTPAKPKRVNNPQRKRPPKKLTNSEWREVLDGQVRENQELRETVEHVRKTLQELREQNKLLKSELSWHLNLGCNQQQKPTEYGPSSADADASKNGETPGSSNDFQKNSDDEYLGRPAVSASVLGCHNRAVVCGYNIPPSSGSEEDCSTPAMDILSSRIIDLNAPPCESLFDSIQNDMDGQIALPMNKALIAAEARKRRIELTRMKSLQSNKLRLR
eukprot:TRINITY_DN23616_c0_g1_i1.p1 TRINITY_DN23616_c0_g1~~TRINITY_DN23616_c0_g1_i1.p1  ORF type:complete len:316 (-),score=70.85 TRINITY_DN23616_c0_g1_i1:355-1302(-)